MSHWTDRYIGVPYTSEFDCMTLVERVAVEVLGICPGVPTAHESGLRAQAEQITRLKLQFSERVDAPIDAQPVLFIARGKFYHAGAVAMLAGETWVLHNDQEIGHVTCQRLRDLAAWHFRFEGYYRWLATP